MLPYSNVEKQRMISGCPIILSKTEYHWSWWSDLSCHCHFLTKNKKQTKQTNKKKTQKPKPNQNKTKKQTKQKQNKTTTEKKMKPPQKKPTNKQTKQNFQIELH